jgi:hypothetical protein
VRTSSRSEPAVQDPLTYINRYIDGYGRPWTSSDLNPKMRPGPGQIAGSRAGLLATTDLKVRGSSPFERASSTSLLSSSYIGNHDRVRRHRFDFGTVGPVGVQRTRADVFVGAPPPTAETSMAPITARRTRAGTKRNARGSNRDKSSHDERMAWARASGRAVGRLHANAVVRFVVDEVVCDQSELNQRTCRRCRGRRLPCAEWLSSRSGM